MAVVTGLDAHSEAVFFLWAEADPELENMVMIWLTLVIQEAILEVRLLTFYRTLE